MWRHGIKILSVLGFLSFFSAASCALVNESSFLKNQTGPDSLYILPPPPANDHVSFLQDQAAYALGRSMQGSERWNEAIADASLQDSNIGKPFSKAFGIEISKTHTPILYDLLRKIRFDSGIFATETAKNHYQRMRPFMFFNSHSCTPDDEPILRTNGSYPSGHAAIGWTTALLLSEILPERTNDLLKRGYEFGQSRVICGVHWQSDVDAGRLMGAAAFAKLHSDAHFLTTLHQAQQEVALILKKQGASQ